MELPNISNIISENIPNLLPQSKLLLSLALGLGLSASSGFRVFVPLLVASIASKLGIIHLGESFQWMGSTTAIVAFATATVLEIGGYYIPFVDNILDTITTPTSVIAGTLLTASVLTPELDPMLKWGLGIIVGGGSAGIVQAGTALTRATSSVATAGVGNPVVATTEHGLSFAGSILSIFMPFIIAAIICIVLFVFLFFLIRYFKKRIYKPKATLSA
ncbi:MAG TPA: DUF4126 domain-containing protein [Chitinophagales bacterium]|nr:DUF4126 domain-containing protein [Chitinophagales bacterium]HMU97329.1 DUF4126 domain-containing protein [Chitinophagales bacterium]HMV01820.1 DUF4126 domain-containing protein [Chitinophagales bacterium]HMW93803.1 DUF4126 domain-containing protein [Chitinophagales bacterium]HMY41448.1 DUF4126 domain-containing protein [Chitinophagales bacterium]